MAGTVLDILGTMLVVVGIAGFASPDLAGAHLSPAHNVVHIAVGAAALWLGLRGSHRNIRFGSAAIAATFVLLAAAGFALGHPVSSANFDQPTDPRVLTLIPNLLQFGTSDHFLNVAIAMAFGIVALVARLSQERQPKTA